MDLEKRWVQATVAMFVADTNGNTASFKGGETKELVGSLAIEAFKLGALAVRGLEGVIDTEVKTDVPDPKDLREAITDACNELRSIGDPDTFTVSGRPKVPAIEAICSEFNREYIDGKLVEEIWKEITGS